MRKILLDELKAASGMLAKYEDKLLAGSYEDSDYMKERVGYWSSVAQQLRVQLFETKSDPSDV
jgi:hypothetical protein